MSNAVLIPMKLQNERLPGKNTRLLNGYPLYSYLFSTMKRVKNVDQVYLDCSDDQILDAGRQWGFTPLRRPVEYNANSVTGDDLLMRVVNEIPHDIISLLHVTSPFVSASTVEKGFRLLETDDSIDSVFGVRPLYNRFWFSGQAINHDITQLVRTQDLSPVYEETDVYFVRRCSLIDYGKRVCGKYGFLEMNDIEAADLDTLVDFVLAEGLIHAGQVEVIPDEYFLPKEHAS